MLPEILAENRIKTRFVRLLQAHEVKIKRRRLNERFKVTAFAGAI